MERMNVKVEMKISKAGTEINVPLCEIFLDKVPDRETMDEIVETIVDMLEGAAGAVNPEDRYERTPKKVPPCKCRPFIKKAKG